VLAGGGNLGAIQVGMLRALVEQAIRPDVVIGCSVGALNGAAFAARPDVVGVARLEELWHGVTGRGILPSSYLPSAIALARRGEAIHSSAPLRRMVEEHLAPITTFAELRLRFECVGTEIEQGDEVWFTSGNVIDAVLASAAIPAVFPAVEIDGHRYLDGGVVNEIPISRAVGLGARRIYVLHAGLYERRPKETRRPFDVLIEAYFMSRRHRYREDLSRLPPDVETVVLPTGMTRDIGPFDLSHTDEMIAAAYEAARTVLAPAGR
jgi:NTE family protein